MKYYIDFGGYCEIEADSPEEADKKFYDTLQRPCTACENEVYEVIGIEEKKEEE